VGCSSTAKKSALRRWSSRIGFAVSIEAMSMVAVTSESSGSAAVTIRPSNAVKWPLTLLIIRCRMTKPTSE
jgi:hypothetical protein